MNKWKIALLGTALIGTQAQAQLNMDVSMSPMELLQNVLVGNGVTISNVTFNGVPSPSTPQLGSGSFTGSNTNLGLAAGLVLSSGGISSIAAPGSDFSSEQLSGYTDPDLSLLGTGTIDDATVLEFDFIPNGDTIKFNYVFGSEEYQEFVCTQFNDVFGFFLSGPGISGGLGYQNDAINIALVPNSTLPVAIGNINNGNPGDLTCVPQNSQYYVDNELGATVVYDGFTTVLQAKAHVTCGEVHHIKLAIADVADQSYDSGVFLEAGSFTTSPFVPYLAPGPGIVGDTIFESCFAVTLDFFRVGDSTVVDTLHLVAGGTATPGVDYFPELPSIIPFAAGETHHYVQLQAGIDVDDLETLIITMQTLSLCSDDTINSTFTFYIDQVHPLVAIGEAFTLECGGSTTLIPDLTGGYGAFTYLWSTGQTSPTITVTPDAPTDYTVQVIDTCGIASEAYFPVSITPLPPLTISLTGPNTLIEGCQGTGVLVGRPSGAVGDLQIDFGGIGQATYGDDYSLLPLTIATGSNSGVGPVNANDDGLAEGPESGIIIATWTYCGQSVSDSVSITIVDAPPIELEVPLGAVIHCSADSVPLLAVASGGVGGLNFSWNNGDVGPLAYALLQNDGQYVVTVTDDCGHTVSDSTFINVQCEVIIPNVISPNGDGQNDVWYIEGLEGSNNSVRIFNRWGQVVFETSNYRNNWAARDLPDGTYFYEVKVDSEPKALTGNLTILSRGRTN